MTRRGRPSKKTAAQVKSNRPIEQVGSREPSSTSSPSSPPSSPLSWYGRITAMNFTSPSAAALSNQSSRHSSPPESSSHNTESTPQVTATEHSSSKEVLYDSSVENQGDGASQHDAPLRLSALYNHPYGPSAPSSSRSRHSRVVVEGNRNSTDPADDETAAESTALADDSSIQSASIRRTNNPNVSATAEQTASRKSSRANTTAAVFKNLEPWVAALDHGSMWWS
ncbi:hypothetical protein EDD21DRAFT_349707 [Dissophora ornata]|nr:hypothetical protein EDD21DRAFT_349707 [Dissophora ornata]